jgi:Rod binding domain-containing protein
MEAHLELARSAASVATLVDSSASPPERGKLAEAAQEFEAYILKMLMAQLRKGLQSGGLFEDRSSDGYRALAEDALARHAAEARSFGLAEQLIRDWERLWPTLEARPSEDGS